MTDRDRMVRAFQAAFEEWDRRHAATPMTGAVADRGAYFAAILDDLAGDRPWIEVGAPR